MSSHSTSHGTSTLLLNFSLHFASCTLHHPSHSYWLGALASTHGSSPTSSRVGLSVSPTGVLSDATDSVGSIPAITQSRMPASAEDSPKLAYVPSRVASEGGGCGRALSSSMIALLITLIFALRTHQHITIQNFFSLTLTTCHSPAPTPRTLTFA